MFWQASRTLLSIRRGDNPQRRTAKGKNVPSHGPNHKQEKEERTKPLACTYHYQSGLPTQTLRGAFVVVMQHPVAQLRRRGWWSLQCKAACLTACRDSLGSDCAGHVSIFGRGGERRGEGRPTRDRPTDRLTQPAQPTARVLRACVACACWRIHTGISASWLPFRGPLVGSITSFNLLFFFQPFVPIVAFHWPFRS